MFGREIYSHPKKDVTNVGYICNISKKNSMVFFINYDIYAAIS